MMIGRTDGTSSSYVNYQLNARDEKSEAIQGKTIGERNQEALDAAQGRISDIEAYQVDLSDLAKGMIIYARSSVVEVSSSIDSEATREDELAALKKGIELYRKMNENYRLTGSPVDPQDEKKRMEDALSGFASGDFFGVVPAKAGENWIRPIDQDFSKAVKTAAGFEDTPSANIEYTPVTEIRTRHYRWTEENGIEETLSREEELAAGKTELRQNLENNVTKSIEAILTPYGTYEEAYDALYGEKGIAPWESFDTEKMAHTMTLKPVQGAFGALANHLNNYLEEFGAEDSFYNTLTNALNELDAYGDNELVNQIRKMIRTTQSGQSIDTTSDKFEEDVTNAIKEAYGGGAKKAEEESKQKKGKKHADEKQGMTFLDMQRRAAEEEGRLLDELLGKEHDSGFESAGDVLKKRKPEDRDMEFTDKLRRVDEREEAAQPFTFAEEEKPESTEVSKDEMAEKEAVYHAWMDISEKLMESFSGEKQGYFEKVLQMSNASGIDIRA